MSAASGTPSAPFATAIYQRLRDDATLAALATGGVFAALPQASRTDRPYVVVGLREFRDIGGPGPGGMQREGGTATVTVDVYSDFHGPQESEDIQTRIRQLLQRVDLLVPGYVLYRGSVMCEDERVFSDFDPDMPERSGYHGVQRWVGHLEELT